MKTKIFSKIVLFIVAIAVMSWFLPWLYALAFPAPSGEPFCSFSPVNNKWILSSARPGQKPVIVVLDSIPADGSDPAVTEITRDERDSLVPQMFYKELLAHEKLPDTIGGKAVSVHSLRTHEMMHNSSPRDIVKRQPGVWMMMESMPVRVELSDADQVFRFTPDGRMEFVDMATNAINESRSRRFTETLTKRGFTFPATDLSANVTSRKQYDEGYLMVDAAGKVFHVKQQAGRPYVAAIKLPEGVTASKVFILEEMNRDIIGLMVDTDNNPWFIEREGYTALPLPIGKIDPRNESVLMMGNLFNFTFRVTGKDCTHWSAIERTPEGYALLGTYDIYKPATTAGKVARYIFPYTLSFVSTTDSLAYPRFGHFSAAALALNAILAIMLWFIYRRHRCPVRWIAPVITLVCGVFSFIPFAVMRD